MNASPHGAAVSKGRFAELTNVSPGRVSQWISEGKIKPDALIGEGRNAKINVEKATLQLRASLDISQRTGNGLDTKLDLPSQLSLARTEPREASDQTPSTPPVKDPIEEQIKRERLDALQRANRLKAIEEAAAAGKFTETADVTRQMGQLAVQLLAVMEGSLSEIATAISAKFQIPQRDALHLMRNEFRKVRATSAKLFRDQAASMPATIEAELDEENESEPPRGNPTGESRTPHDGCAGESDGAAASG